MGGNVSKTKGGMVFDADGVFDKRINRLDSKVSQEVEQRIYADSSLNERINKIKYYGDADIEISPDEWFVFNDEEHTVLGGFSEGHENETSIVIPYSVTTIGDSAFYQCKSITSVTIPNSVTTICRQAFSGCSSLTSVTIPDSVTTIGDSAFLACRSLTSITIPDSVTYISGNVFLECNNLTIYCSQGSYADTFAREYNIPVKYTDIYIDKTVTENSENAVSSGAVFEAVSEAVSMMSAIADEAKSDSLQAISTSESANTTAQQAIANADNAIEIAQSVRADADNGVFNGKDGADYIITEADKEEIKSDVVETLTRSSTALPEMLDVNTIYDLGEQDALTLNLPAGKLGDFIEVDFLSTQTPTTLTITASTGMSDNNLIPDANTIYSLYFNWIRLDAENYGWGFGYAEYTRTVTE